MPDWSVVAVYLGLVLLAMLRGTASYAIGRGVRGLAGRRWDLDASWVVRGEAIVRRFGAPAVTLCFLTVGLQTAVLVGAGTLRMPPRRFFPALLLGALMWAGVYTTIGFTVVQAIWGSGTFWLVLLVVAGVALLAWWVRQLLRRRPPGRSPQPPG